MKREIPLEAMEVLTTGWCPLNCRYCYIPKTEKMKELHAKIITEFLEKDFIDALARVPGRKTFLGLWGTEPTLTLSLIQKKLGELKKRFPELKRISFSTNMMLPPSIIVQFIREAEKYGIAVDVQVSLDGPAFITDKNRGPGATKTIVEHVTEFVDLLNEVSIKTPVELRWKATLTPENIKEMVEDQEKVHEYFRFFNSLTENLVRRNKLKNLRIVNSSAPTLMVPGKYTKRDGELLAEFFELLARHKYPNAYVFRFLRLLNFYEELSAKPRMFTCSGGDSNIGFDGSVHICHRTFYFNHPEYVESILDMPEYKNWDVSHLAKGTIDMINKYYIVNPEDETNFARFLYVMRGYHDFWRFKLAATCAIIKELAYAGQASEVYEDDDWAKLLALFINTALSCPMENLLNVGSVFIPPVSIIRVFANGAFEIIVREALKYVRG